MPLVKQPITAAAQVTWLGLICVKIVASTFVAGFMNWVMYGGGWRW